MKILITGCAGFIGSHTTEFFLKKGHDVLGIDDLSSGKLENLSTVINCSNFQFVQQDLCSGMQAVAPLFAKFQPEVVLHLAALVSVTESVKFPEKNFMLNVRAFQSVMESARLANVRRVVFASSAAVYGNTEIVPIPEEQPFAPLSPYGSGKVFGESLLSAYNGSYGIEWVALRYFNVFGPRQDALSPYAGVISIFVEKMTRGEDLTVFGDGGQTRDFIYVKDVARYNADAVELRNLESGAYNVCTGKGSSINDLIVNLKEIYPLKGQILYDKPRDGEIYHSRGVNKKLVSAFNFQPEFDLKSGLKDWVSFS